MPRPRLIPTALLLCALALGGTAHAQEVRVRGGAATVEAAPGLEASVFARGLGEVSDLALSDDGTLFASDRRSGRIWVLRDRGSRGRADTVQALPQRFDTPTGILSVDGTLFVADRGGLWRLGASGTPALVAPFQNSGSLPEPHPIALAANGRIRLGLGFADGTARLLLVDPDTGAAELEREFIGALAALSKGPPGAPAFAVGRMDGRPAMVAIGGPSAVGAAIPLDTNASALWVDPEAGQLLVSGPTGVHARQATLAGVAEDIEPLLVGAAAGALVVDGRGILVAVPGDGTVRLIRPASEAEAASDPAPGSPGLGFAEPDAARSPLDPGSLILRGSGIGQASRYEEIRDSTRPESGDDSE